MPASDTEISAEPETKKPKPEESATAKPDDMEEGGEMSGVSETDKNAWAQLISTTDTESEPVIITKDKFIIGRSKGI